MKWQDYWDYLSLQVWNSYGLQADLEQAKIYYPLTPEGEQLITQFGGGQIKGPDSGIVTKFVQLGNQSPKSAIRTKKTGLVYPTIRRDTQFTMQRENFRRAWDKMESGRFPMPLAPLLHNFQPTVNNPTGLSGQMLAWDGGFYLIKCESSNHKASVELQYLQNLIGTTLRFWKEAQKSSTNVLTAAYTGSSGISTGPFVGNEGLHDLLQEVVQQRRNMRGGQWSGQLANYTNAGQQQSYGFRRQVPVGHSVAPVDLQARLEHMMTFNPEDFVVPTNMWLWIHIDKDRKGNLRDIHCVNVHDNSAAGANLNYYDSLPWKPVSTLGPRWVGSHAATGPDIVRENLLEEVLADGLGWITDEVYDDATLSLPSPPTQKEILDTLTDHSKNFSEGDLITIPKSIFAAWPDVERRLKLFQNDQGPETFEGLNPAWDDLIHSIYATLSYTDVAGTAQPQGHPTNYAAVPHYRLYDADSGKELPWTGNYHINSVIVDAVTNAGINGQNPNNLHPPLRDNVGTSLTSVSGLIPNMRMEYNENFLNRNDNHDLQPAALNQLNALTVNCQPRYYSSGGKTYLSGQMAWWLNGSMPQANITPPQWQMDTSIPSYDPDRVGTLMSGRYAGQWQPYEGTDMSGAVYKHPTLSVAPLIQNYQHHIWIDTDENIIQSSPSNRIDFQMSRIQGEPETVTWPALKITGEYYYSETGFNLDSLPDSKFTPFINWNKGFTRRVWEFIEQSVV